MFSSKDCMVVCKNFVLYFLNCIMMANSNCISHVLTGMLLHAFGVILAIIIPAMAAGLRLLFTKNAMNW
jgi:hypothetical protein